MWRAEICAAVACISLLLITWKLLRCVHAWELVDKTELPSKFEEMKKQGWIPQELSMSLISILSQKTIIIVIRCPKCGTPKILREKN